MKRGMEKGSSTLCISFRYGAVPPDTTPQLPQKGVALMFNPFVLSLIPKGTPTHPRYLIGNQVQVWNGDSWSLDEEEGLLFASEAEAKNSCLVMSDFCQMTTRRFSCRIEFEVKADSPTDINSLRNWLAKNARLYVNDGMSSLDGEHDSLIVAIVDFFGLEEG